MYGTPSQRMPETEAMLTIAPLPCLSICGSTCLQVRNMLFKLTSLTRSQLSSVVSTGPPTSTIPTLLCSTSILPNAAMPASTIAATAPSTCGFGSAGLSRLARCIRNLAPTHATDLGPDLECLGPRNSVLGGSDVIAAETEEVVDLIVG